MNWRFAQPLLLAGYFVLFLGGANLDHLSLAKDVLPVLLLALLISAAVLEIAARLLGDRSRGTLAATLMVVSFFCYGYLYQAGVDREGLSLLGRNRFLVPLLLAVVILLYWFATRKRATLSAILLWANVVAGVLLLQAIGTIVAYYSGFGRAPVTLASVPPATWNGSTRPPDILYLVLDGYGGSQALSEVFDFSNEEFLGYLESRGFFVARESHSNFSHTFLSLASTLNMAFVDDLMEPELFHGSDVTVPRLLIRDNAVVRGLKDLGYRYVHFSSGWFPTNENRNADVHNPCGKRNEFLKLLSRTTAWRTLGLRRSYKKRERLVLCTFERLPEVFSDSEPVFVFAHVMVPHPPLVFGADGSLLDFPRRDAAWTPKPRYLAQLEFVNGKVRQLLEHPALASDELVVIIQSDHGPAAALKVGEDSKPNRAGVIERMSILNAFRFPDGDYGELYQSITSVNTFPAIFRKFFGAEIQFRPDRSYFSNYDRPYEIVDVTDQVLGDFRE